MRSRILSWSDGSVNRGNESMCLIYGFPDSKKPATGWFADLLSAPYLLPALLSSLQRYSVLFGDRNGLLADFFKVRHMAKPRNPNGAQDLIDRVRTGSAASMRSCPRVRSTVDTLPAAGSGSGIRPSARAQSRFSKRSRIGRPEGRQLSPARSPARSGLCRLHPVGT